MKQFLSLFYNYQGIIYKSFLFLPLLFFIVYVFPIKSQFAFEFTPGETWSYETLYSPFDFAIIKSEEEVQEEKQQLRQEAITYFDVDATVAPEVFEAYTLNFKNYFPFDLKHHVTNVTMIMA